MRMESREKFLSPQNISGYFKAKLHLSWFMKKLFTCAFSSAATEKMLALKTNMISVLLKSVWDLRVSEYLG